MDKRVTRRLASLLGRSVVLVSLAALTSASSGNIQNDPIKAAGSSGVALRLDRVALSVGVDAVLRASTTAGYVLCDGVLQDKRLVSLRFQSYQLTLSNVSLWLAAQGYALRDKGGVLYVCTSDDRRTGSAEGGGSDRAQRAGSVESSEVPQGYAPGVVGGASSGDRYAGSSRGGEYSPATVPVGSPLAPGPMYAGGPVARGAVPGGVFEVAAYRPDYVDPATIAEVVRAMLPEASVAVSVARIDARPAVFVRGAPEVVERFRTLAHYVDTPAERVEVSAILAEVSTSGRAGWSVQAVASALTSRLGISIGGASGGIAAGGDSLSFKSGDFSAVLGVVGTTSNTRVLSTPRVSGRSGESLRLQVGSDVPVLGAIVATGGIANTAQEVQYRSSGVIFEVLPLVHGKTVTLAIKQELSAFAETETGVRGSPTLSKRELTSSVDMEDGEWLVIGGLTSSETVKARNTLFGVVPTGRQRVSRETELVLIINVRIIRREALKRSAPVVLPASLDAGSRN